MTMRPFTTGEEEEEEEEEEEGLRRKEEEEVCLQKGEKEGLRVKVCYNHRPPWVT